MNNGAELGKEKVKVGVIQLCCNLNQSRGNLRRALRMIDQGAGLGVDLFCLPEAFATAVDLVHIKDIAETIPGKTSDALCGKAKETNSHIIAGILESSDGQFYSTAVLINNLGEIHGTYRRVFTFKLEKRYLSGGAEFKIFITKIGKIGVIMGYDINFPEACRNFFREKVELIVCPSLLPLEYCYVTDQLIKARAIENSCYFAFSSGLGENQFAGFEYMGNSQIVVSPVFLEEEKFDFMEGDETLAKAGREEALITAELNLSRLNNKKLDSGSIYESTRQDLLCGYS